MDNVVITEALKKRKREKERVEHSVAVKAVLSSPTTSRKEQFVVNVDDHEIDAPHVKIQKSEFLTSPLKEGHSCSVTVPNDFMSLDKSIWSEVEKFLFPCAEERLRERSMPGLMLNGLN